MQPNIIKREKGRKRYPAELLLAGIANWAKQLPEYEWTPGPPPFDLAEEILGDKKPTYVAVKTETGRIITGTRRAFRRRSIRHIEDNSRYGLIIAHVVLE